MESLSQALLGKFLICLAIISLLFLLTVPTFSSKKIPNVYHKYKIGETVTLKVNGTSAIVVDTWKDGRYTVRYSDNNGRIDTIETEEVEMSSTKTPMEKR